MCLCGEIVPPLQSKIFALFWVRNMSNWGVCSPLCVQGDGQKQPVRLNGESRPLSGCIGPCHVQQPLQHGLFALYHQYWSARRELECAKWTSGAGWLCIILFIPEHVLLPLRNPAPPARAATYVPQSAVPAAGRLWLWIQHGVWPCAGMFGRGRVHTKMFQRFSHGSRAEQLRIKAHVFLFLVL
jgi:hypothetical protein